MNYTPRLSYYKLFRTLTEFCRLRATRQYLAGLIQGTLETKNFTI